MNKYILFLLFLLLGSLGEKIVAQVGTRIQTAENLGEYSTDFSKGTLTRGTTLENHNPFIGLDGDHPFLFTGLDDGPAMYFKVTLERSMFFSIITAQESSRMDAICLRIFQLGLENNRVLHFRIGTGCSSVEDFLNFEREPGKTSHINDTFYLEAGEYYIAISGVGVGYNSVNYGYMHVSFIGRLTLPDPSGEDPDPPLPPDPDPSLNLSSGHNYIYTITPTVPVSNASNLPLNQSLQTVQYFDGLGRPMETIQRGFSPSKKDIISYQEYDFFGRESNSWLPVAVSSQGSGSFVALSTLSPHYASNYPNENKPYSKPVYEASPLNRVLEQYGPGQHWHDNSRSVRSYYLTNISGNDTLNCIYYTASPVSGDSGLVVNRVKNYDTSQLFVTRVQNEDGHTTFEFKDKLDRVVLIRQIQREGTSKSLYDTYFIYDDFGNQLVVLPPLASDAFRGTGFGSWNSKTNADLKDFAYLYKYDHRNRMIAKKLPGCSWTYYVYDMTDRLIFTQDGEQRIRGEWAFSIPDAFGRPCLTGICKNTLNALSITSPPLSNVIIAQRDDTNSTYKGYSFSSLTLLNSLLLSVNYYDDYTFLNKTAISEFNNSRFDYDSSESLFDTRYVKSSKTLLTGTLTAKLDDTSTPSFLGSVMYYDHRNRIIQTLSDNHLGDMDKSYVAYNFTGQPVKSKHVHKASNRSTWTEYYAYNYDHAVRLIETTHQLSEVTSSGIATNYPERVLSRNTYDELGRLISTETNNQSNLATDYEYNVRSWIKEIANPLFSERLDYTFGGNIHTQEWDQANRTRKYAFTYDHLSQLKGATFSSANGGNYSTSYSYDKHGNIQTLSRYGNTGSSTYGKIDYLVLDYNGNQLKKVEDIAANPTLSPSMDFRNGSKDVMEYFYDRNGNMTKDLNKGISSIEYNLLNLPKKLTISNSYGASTNTYLYAANGQKLRVTKNSHTNDYVGNMIYENDLLKRILTANGYFEGGKYYFYVKDHLGNNRVVVDQDETVVQSTQYYPFGMSYADGIETSKQPYRYNGKELDGERGLNWYDYGRRMLSLDVGRLTTMDRFCEKYYHLSPYQLAANNPVNNMEINGDSIWFTYKYDNDDKLTDVTMHVKGKVLNDSYQNVDVDKAISTIGGAIKSTFNGKSKGVTFKTEVELTQAKSMKEVKTNDHLFVLTENLSSIKDGSISGASNIIGGKVAFLDVDYFIGYYDVAVGKWGEGGRTAAHEMGHLSGLNHTNNPFNIMRQGGLFYGINMGQLQDMNNKWVKGGLNKGENYEYNIRGIKRPNRGGAAIYIRQ